MILDGGWDKRDGSHSDFCHDSITSTNCRDSVMQDDKGLNTRSLSLSFS